MKKSLLRIFSDTHDAIKFITREQHLSNRTIREAALAATKVIHEERKQSRITKS